MAVIIAELCQNHKGDRKLLGEMLWAAAAAGSDYVKIQTIRSSDLTFRPRFEDGEMDGETVKTIKRPYQPEYDRLKTLDLDEETTEWFIEECGRARVKPLTTVFTRATIPFIASLPWREVKVASYDCASYPMLLELAERFDHLYISTGATFDEEIEKTAALLKGKDYTFLHCITIYPTPLDELNLARMEYLRRFTPSVGFSDHTLVARDGIKASVAALAYGADVIERHFTILPADQTKDGPVSITPALLKDLAAFAHGDISEVRDYVKREIPEAEKMRGRQTRPLSHVEMLNRDYYRGRFASRAGSETVYNWEDRPVV